MPGGFDLYIRIFWALHRSRRYTDGGEPLGLSPAEIAAECDFRRILSPDHRLLTRLLVGEADDEVLTFIRERRKREREQRKREQDAKRAAQRRPSVRRRR